MSKSEQKGLLVGGQQKITVEHWQRLACIYVRQSSPKQVLHNLGSQYNQYGLADRAEALGWKRERIRIIDADQGISGDGRQERDGFQELVTAVSLNQVGIIFSYEVARLARNNQEWYHLLDLAAVFGTLIADIDGIYDPRLYNDRLLLGLKGTLSEAELHLIQQRLNDGRLRKVERGEYRQRLPTGLVRLPDGSVVKDPDAQVRHTIELVLVKFEELGSGGQVLRYLHRENILLPRCQTSGTDQGQVVWKVATYDKIYDIIKNPAYAGTFAYGRRPHVDKQRQASQSEAKRLRFSSPEDWIQMQQDVYPAYISWEQYLRNQERLKQNATLWNERTQPAQGAAQRGKALLQGLTICGCCGYRMQVKYPSGAAPRYVCLTLHTRFKEPRCASLHAPSIDQVVVQAFFEAIQPAQLDALTAVLAEQEAERERLSQQWNERLKRVEYEVHLARRQYDAVDPDNRLVAAELERRWEEKLHQFQTSQEAYAHFEQTIPPTTLGSELREQLQHISETLPDLWHGDQLSNVHKKQLLRTLIDKVIVKREKPETVSVKIVWVCGYYSTFEVYPPIGRLADDTRYEEMLEQIRTLWQQDLDDKEIAQRLTAAGFKSARTDQVLASAVRRERLVRGWYSSFYLSYNAPKAGQYLTVGGIADQLGVKKHWVYHQLATQKIDPGLYIRHIKSRIYLFLDTPETIEQIRSLLPPGLQMGGEQ
jgi:DNA invertase Pin-like site-specific DNA recombinase